MSSAVDLEYADLLQKIQPKVPSNREENEHLLAEIERLMRKGEEKLSPAEDAMLETLFSLVREYEQRMYPAQKSTPADMLRFLMEENHLRAVDLPLRGNRVSEILSGKREVSKADAKALGDFFHISPAVFI
jgi:HTH-type transcriptional regulator / antitoxin HigA